MDMPEIQVLYSISNSRPMELQLVRPVLVPHAQHFPPLPFLVAIPAMPMFGRSIKDGDR